MSMSNDDELLFCDDPPIVLIALNYKNNNPYNAIIHVVEIM